MREDLYDYRKEPMAAWLYVALTAPLRFVPVLIIMMLFVGCILSALASFTDAPPPAPLEGLARVALLSAMTMVTIFAAVVSWYWSILVIRPKHANHERYKQYRSQVEDIMTKIGEVEPTSEDYPIHTRKYEAMFIVPAKDCLYWSGPAIMSIQKTTRHRVKEKYTEVEGAGFLFITSKGVTFISMGSDKNWSKKWDGIASWQHTIGHMLVQLSSGAPKNFSLVESGCDPTEDALVCNACMYLASSRT
jgi:hypothetical protein